MFQIAKSPLTRFQLNKLRKNSIENFYQKLVFKTSKVLFKNNEMTLSVFIKHLFRWSNYKFQAIQMILFEIPYFFICVFGWSNRRFNFGHFYATFKNLKSFGSIFKLGTNLQLSKNLEDQFENFRYQLTLGVNFKILKYIWERISNS
jgi:hypothetical protein